MRRPRLLLAASAMAVLLLAACGGGGLPTMSDDASGRVDREVAAVRYAVMARDADGASRALATLRASVERLRRSGDLTSAKAHEILAAASGVQAQLVAITTTTTTTTMPPAPPTKPVKGPRGGDEEGQGKKGPH